MSKHTPGPWTLTHKFGSNHAVQEFEIRGMFGEAPNVYPIFNKDAWAIDGATVFMHPKDARLIAAAPDLLQALKSCVDALIVGATGERDRALTAIAKAEGRS